MVRGVWAGCVLACLPGMVWAHGGGLDSSGCHHDRKRGGYHCHRDGYTRPSQGSSGFDKPPSRGWMEERAQQRRQERAAQDAEARDRMEQERLRRARDKQAEKEQADWDREVQELRAWDPLLPPEGYVPSHQKALRDVLPSPRRSPARRQAAPLAGPSGGMEGGLRDLINTKAGAGACAAVAEYILVPGGVGFVARCTNGESRFQVRPQGRTNRVEACVPSPDLRAPC